jgi:hypothetical protein
MTYTILPVNMNGNLLGHGLGIYGTCEEAKKTLTNAGFYETEQGSMTFSSEEGEAYHIIMITKSYF